MKVSIITPCNRPQDIENVLENFQRQKYEDKELIFVYSDIPFNDVIENLRHPGVTAIDLSNSVSIGQMLNSAIGSAAGRIILRMDSDDHYSPFYIQHGVDTLLQHDKPTLVGLSSCFFYDELTNRAWEYTWNDISQRLVVGASHCFYREAWQKYKYPENLDRAWGEDNVFCSQFPKVVYGDYKEHFVAIKHGRNTSPYNFRDSCYEPANAEYVRSLMK